MAPTVAERDTGLLNDQHLTQAIQCLHDNGYVILEAVLPAPLVNSLNHNTHRVLDATHQGSKEELVRTRGHGGTPSPMRMPFLDPRIIENPMIFQVLERVLGKYFFGSLPYGCNTAFPGSQAQNVHRDCGHLFPDLQIATPPVLIVANIALDDFTADNGATEIWPGSHHALQDEEAEIDTLKVRPKRLADRPSLRTEMPAGSIVLRDMRTWHRGMPNLTDSPRTMLSLVYYRKYYLPDGLSLPLPPLSDEVWEQLSTQAKWTYRLRRS